MNWSGILADQASDRYWTNIATIAIGGLVLFLMATWLGAGIISKFRRRY